MEYLFFFFEDIFFSPSSFSDSISLYYLTYIALAKWQLGKFPPGFSHKMGNKGLPLRLCWVTAVLTTGKQCKAKKSVRRTETA